MGAIEVSSLCNCWAAVEKLTSFTQLTAVELIGTERSLRALSVTVSEPNSTRLMLKQILFMNEIAADSSLDRVCRYLIMSDVWASFAGSNIERV